jgi:hypothetical protein
MRLSDFVALQHNAPGLPCQGRLAVDLHNIGKRLCAAYGFK